MTSLRGKSSNTLSPCYQTPPPRQSMMEELAGIRNALQASRDNPQGRTAVQRVAAFVLGQLQRGAESGQAAGS